MNPRNIPLLALVFVTGALVALGGFFLLGRDGATAAGPGHGGPGMMGGAYSGTGMMNDGSYGGMGGGGMMGGGGGMMGGGSYGPGMMGGYSGSVGSVPSSVTQAELTAARDRVQKQLANSGYEGFTVGEIMAFTSNDYVLVKDASGKPAFELLADPKGQWLTPEPGPNMMWNTSFGMMRGVSVPDCPFATGSTSGRTSGTTLTAARAKTRADAWLVQHFPGRVTADATSLPGYFTIDVTSNGKKVGMLSVNQTTGAVWYHTWHGEFLADQDF